METRGFRQRIITDQSPRSQVSLIGIKSPEPSGETHKTTLTFTMKENDRLKDIFPTAHVIFQSA